jgi:hypothetical protein
MADKWRVFGDYVINETTGERVRLDSMAGASVGPVDEGTEKTSTWRVSGGYAINDTTGERFRIDYSSVKGLARGTTGQLDAAILHYLNTNTMPDKSQITPLGSEQRWRNISEGLGAFIDSNDLTTDVLDGSVGAAEYEIDPKTLAQDEYWRDVYSLDKGTTGERTLRNLEGIYENQAREDMRLAEVQYQQQAMQQAQVVKQITDQIRSERMARLRAGMSESQIANQDMQMLMANVNSLNQQNTMMNQERLNAQANMNTAKDQAYLQYLDTAQGMGQNAAANYASSSSNANYATLQRLQLMYGSDPTKWTQKQKEEAGLITLGITDSE